MPEQRGSAFVPSFKEGRCFALSVFRFCVVFCGVRLHLGVGCFVARAFVFTRVKGS